MISTDERKSARSTYIRSEDPAEGAPVDREAQLHRRRKNAMNSLLTEFEREIEPLIGPGHGKVIENFKRSCREKLNGLTFQAVELMGLGPGEHFNEAAADLAEHIEFDRNGGTTKP
jgi:hypothetical protein